MTPIQQLMLGVGAKKKVYMDDVYSTYVYPGEADAYSTQTIVNNLDLATEGGMVWIKNRDNSQIGVIGDSVRGNNKYLVPSTTGQQATSSNRFKQLTTTGFQVGGDSDTGISGDDYASWSFRKSPGFFTCLSYTGNGTSGKQIAHDLGSIPGFIIIKRTDAGGNWNCYHTRWSVDGTRLLLNSSDAASDYGTLRFDVSTVSSTHFSIGSQSEMNANGGTFIAYLFAGGESTAATARSVDFDGTGGDRLESANSSDYNFGSGNFTVEGWIRGRDNSLRGVVGLWAYSNNRRSWIVQTEDADDGEIEFWASSNGSTGTKILSGGKVSRGQWHHFAVARSGNTIKLFLNGIEVDSASYSDTLYNNTQDPLVIGGIYTNDYVFKGEISNLRIVKGTAVYTSSFRPTYEPLTNITNTKLLCCNNSSTTGSTTTSGTITALGDPTASTDSPFDDPAGFKFGEESNENIVKCGIYTGNASTTGPEINLGWEPQWVMIKATDLTENWIMFDSMRGIFTAGNDMKLHADQNIAESTGNDFMELTATGFKIKKNSNIINGDNNKYLYICIRRSDGYVQKPAELGTSVFNLIGGTSSANPTFVSGFPVDFAFQRKPAQSQDWYTGTRLTGDKNMRLNQNQAESTTGSSSSWRWDYQNGWHEFSGNQTANQSWMWKRGHGLDISLYVGTGSSSKPAVIRHGLGKKPEMVWFKKRNESDPWIVYHHGLLGGVNPETSTVKLNYNNQQGSGQSGYAYDSTAVTLTTTWDQVNDVNINHLCVLFCSVDGISKVGSYSGTGSSGNAQNIGFQPRFLVVKRVDSSGSWYVFDSLRTTSNPFRYQLELNTPNQQDFVNKVTVSSTGWSFIDLNINENGSKYIYYAHA